MSTDKRPWIEWKADELERILTRAHLVMDDRGYPPAEHDEVRRDEQQSPPTTCAFLNDSAGGRAKPETNQHKEYQQ